VPTLTLSPLSTTTPLPAPTQLPTYTPSPTATPRPTFSPVLTSPIIQIVFDDPGLALDGLTQTINILGDQVFIGAVENKTNESLPGISVSLEFKDQANNRVVETRSASILLIGEVGAGERVPFVSGLPESELRELWDTVQVIVSLDPFVGFLGYKSIPGLEITDFDSSKGEVNGLIFNDSDQLLGGTDIGEGFLIGVIGYDAADRVVMVGSDDVGERLEPGWSTGFEIIYMWGTPEKAVRYEARVIVK
jgi:hypothetical protein